MKISPILQPLLDPARPVAILLKQLQVGRILEARVTQQIQPGLLRLQMAGTEVLARSEVSLPTGSRVRLEVSRAQPQPELRILHAPDAGQRQQMVVRSAMARQLPPSEVRQQVRELLSQPPLPTQIPARAQTQPQAPISAPDQHPRQAPVPATPQAPASSAAPATSQTPTLTARSDQGIRQFVDILRDAGIRPDQLSPGQVRRAVQQSGLFHEARLAQALPVEQGDTKTRLLQLLHQLQLDPESNRPLPRPGPENADSPAQARTRPDDSLLARLTRLIEASVSRIQLQQAASLPTEDSPRQAWQLDLPVQLPDESHEMMLRIERDTGGARSSGGSTWSVNLAFQFDTIGSLQCRVGLAGERVSATFWSERDATHRRLEQRLPVLQQAFEAQGLEVAHLRGVLGEPAEALIRVPVTDGLLDEHA